jgi:hypothetical protein
MNPQIIKNEWLKNIYEFNKDVEVLQSKTSTLIFFAYFGQPFPFQLLTIH